MKRKLKFRVGQVAYVSFKRHDGSFYTGYGRIERIWGKVPYAVTFADQISGAIRVGIDELRHLTAKERNHV